MLFVDFGPGAARVPPNDLLEHVTLAPLTTPLGTGASVQAAYFRLASRDRKSTRLNSSHTVIYTLSLHDALPISRSAERPARARDPGAADDSARDRRIGAGRLLPAGVARSEEHTSELQSHSDLHSFPTRRSSDLAFRRTTCSST